MSNIPVQPTPDPDLSAEETAAKHGISVEEAKKLRDQNGTDRATVDGAAEEYKSKD